MRSLLSAALAACALVAPAFGQFEVNKPGASLDVDGLVTDGTFAAASSHGTNSSVTVGFTTDNIGFPFDIAFNTAALVGPGIPLAGQSVNLDLGAGFTFLSGANGFLATGGALGGTSYALQLGITLPAAPGDLSLQAYSISPVNPGGLDISQASQMTMFLDFNIAPSALAANPLGTPVVLADDGNALMPLATPFVFYGQTYNDCYVNSNGNVTFGAGDNDFSETVPEFLSGAPRIAQLWDDFNPTVGGTVTFFSDASGINEVAFTGISEFGTTNSNNFVLQFGNSQVTMDYAAVVAPDGIVGTSPGGGLALGQTFNLSGASTAAILPNEAPYELFDAANPFDLSGWQVSMFLDGTGTPLLFL